MNSSESSIRLNRRSFMKRTASTLLTFGLGATLANATDVSNGGTGAATTCPSGSTCYTIDVTNVTPAPYGGEFGNQCSMAQGNLTNPANCTIVDSEACAKELAGQNKQYKKASSSPPRWCVW